MGGSQWRGAHLGLRSSVSCQRRGAKQALMPSEVVSKPDSSGSPLAFSACTRKHASGFQCLANAEAPHVWLHVYAPEQPRLQPEASQTISCCTWESAISALQEIRCQGLRSCSKSCASAHQVARVQISKATRRCLYRALTPPRCRSLLSVIGSAVSRCLCRGA